MLAIILGIIKIIGIVLLGLIVLLIVLGLAVLFVPVRYYAKGELQSGYRVEGRITWFLHLITLTVKMQDAAPFSAVVRLLGIPIFRIPGKQKRADKETLKTELEEVTRKSEQTPKRPEISGAESGKKTDEAAQETEGFSRTVDEEQEDTQEKLSVFGKIKTFIKKNVSFFSNIRYTIQKIYDNIVDIRTNVNYYSAVLQSEETRLAFLLCKKRLLRIWHNIRPKKFHVFVRFGIEESPDIMGQILAVWGMLYPFHQGKVEVEADFEQTVLEGSFVMKGYTSVYVYMWTLYLVLFDKNIRILRKRLSRKEK